MRLGQGQADSGPGDLPLTALAAHLAGDLDGEQGVRGMPQWVLDSRPASPQLKECTLKRGPYDIHYAAS